MLIKIKRGFFHSQVYDESDRLLYTIKSKITLNHDICIYKEDEVIVELKQKLFTRMLPIYEIYEKNQLCGRIIRELYFPYLSFSISWYKMKMICNSTDFIIRDEKSYEIGNIYQHSHVPDTIYIQIRDSYEIIGVLVAYAMEWGKER